jgi:hypothetical protein
MTNKSVEVRWKIINNIIWYLTKIWLFCPKSVVQNRCNAYGGLRLRYAKNKLRRHCSTHNLIVSFAWVIALI